MLCRLTRLTLKVFLLPASSSALNATVPPLEPPAGAADFITSPLVWRVSISLRHSSGAAFHGPQPGWLSLCNPQQACVLSYPRKVWKTRILAKINFFFLREPKFNWCYHPSWNIKVNPHYSKPADLGLMRCTALKKYESKVPSNEDFGLFVHLFFFFTQADSNVLRFLLTKCLFWPKTRT